MIQKDEKETKSAPVTPNGGSAVAPMVPAEEVVITLDESTADQDVITEMAKAGVLYGHKKFRRNPKFEDYVYTVRNGVEIIDLAKTLKAIEIVAGVVKKAMVANRNILVVGTQAAAHDAVVKLAPELKNCSTITNKWIGGLISNFSVLSKRLEYFRKRQRDFEEGRFDKYTKKERLMIEREIEKMAAKFAGLESFIQVPEVMMIIDTAVAGHRAALREARLKGITVIGIIDNDDNPEDFDYFIPANDHTRSSIEWVLERLAQSVK